MTNLAILEQDLDPDVLPADAVIAVDGPAGSGKSTTARFLAEHYGLVYIDTGAMYRTLTWAAQEAGVEVGNEAALLDMLIESQVEFKPGRGEAVVLWNGKDVSTAIRTPEAPATRYSTRQRRRTVTVTTD